ncbi:MAG: leucine-rich repeat domain-containing protein [Clostridia bacterium]|nr:leucine-rich repeat domain-containing protein [Clostridia bacterium]
MKRLFFVLMLCCLLTACATPDGAVEESIAPSAAPSSTPTFTSAPTATPSPEPTATPDPTPVLIGEISVPYGAESLDLQSLPYTIAEVAAVKQELPALKILWSFELYGRTLCTTDEGEIDLSYSEVGDMDELIAALSLLENAETVNLSHCNLSNEELAALREQVTNTKVVWTIRFRRWELRTDAVAFSTFQDDPPAYALTSGDVDALRYCTELVALDLGHNAITELSFLEPLTELKVLLLSDNYITDISVLAKLDKLMYLEMFLNRISDLSPLAGKTSLLDLNLCYNRFTDVSAIISCENLERIWLAQCEVSDENRARLTAAFPNAVFDFDSPSCTRNGWREHPRYFAYITMLRENILVAPFN